MEVVKTTPGPRGDHRFRRCACGSRGWSEERWFKWLPAVAGSPPATLPVTAGNPPATLGGRGGLLRSSSALSLPGLGADPDLTSVVSKQEKGKIGRGDAKDYGEFEVLWSGCDPLPRGTKFKAFVAWSKLKPSPTLTLAVFLRWRESDDWRRGFEPHMSTWLNARGWEKEPTAAEMAPRGTGNGAPRDVRKGWAPPAPASAHGGGEVDMRAIMKEAEGK